MTITLKTELEAMIREDVARGLHDSIEHFLEAAVLSMHQQDLWMGRNAAEVERLIEEGWQQARKGELHPEASVELHMKAVKAAWQANPKL